MAALTAPQLLWPSTMTKGAPSSATPYSMLPFTAMPSTTLPATRTTNKSPTPWSKRSSGATRESAQPTMTAIGNCPSASAEKSSGLRRGLAGRPSTNRPLPSNNVCSASSAVGRVGGWAAGSGAGRAVPRLPSTSPAAVIPLIHRNSRREEDMTRSFRVGRASALGRCAHHRPRVAPAPASALHRTQKLLHLAVKHRRLFQVDGVAGPGLDEQPGRRDRAFQEDAGLQAGVVFIPDYDQGGNRQCGKLFGKIVQGRPLGLVVFHRQRRALGGMLAQVIDEFLPPARVFVQQLHAASADAQFPRHRR